MTHFFSGIGNVGKTMVTTVTIPRYDRLSRHKRVHRKVSDVLSAIALVKVTRGVAYHPAESHQRLTGYRCVTTRKKCSARSTISFYFRRGD